jgi:1-acyl-sn-glycerol-3-phosphate acyltransferase
MIRKIFKTLYLYPWILVSTLVMGLVTIVITVLIRPLDRAQHLGHRVARCWARSILWASGVKVTVLGAAHLAGGRSMILMPNHQSHFDIPVLLGALDCQFRWLAKAELFKIPVFGRAMRGCGYISIDRSDRQSAFASIGQAGDTIRGRASVLIFPEGTRSPDGHLLPFKKGGFVLAVDAGVPILPIGIYGTRRILPKNRWLLDPGPVVLCLQAPIATEGFDRQHKEALMDLVREGLTEGLAGARRGSSRC